MLFGAVVGPCRTRRRVLAVKSSHRAREGGGPRRPKNRPLGVSLFVPYPQTLGGPPTFRVSFKKIIRDSGAPCVFPQPLGTPPFCRKRKRRWTTPPNVGRARVALCPLYVGRARVALLIDGVGREPRAWSLALSAGPTPRSLALSGALWRSLALSGGTTPCSLALSGGTTPRSLALSGALWRWRFLAGLHRALWQSLAVSGGL